jgi:hypothetical protein
VYKISSLHSACGRLSLFCFIYSTTEQSGLAKAKGRMWPESKKSAKNRNISAKYMLTAARHLGYNSLGAVIGATTDWEIVH